MSPGRGEEPEELLNIKEGKHSFLLSWRKKPFLSFALLLKYQYRSLTLKKRSKSFLKVMNADVEVELLFHYFLFFKSIF